MYSEQNTKFTVSRRGWLWAAIGLGIFILLSSLPEIWAAPAQAPTRQTIPTPTPTPPPKCPASTDPCCDAKDPVIFYNGELALNPVDMQIPGRGIPFEFRRRYSSQIELVGPLGHNWDFSYNAWIERKAADGLMLYDGYGRKLLYVDSGDGIYVIRGYGYYYQLTENTDESFTLRYRDGAESHFHALDGSAIAGRLERITDPNGNMLQLRYNQGGQLINVLDTLGRSMAFYYDANRRLAEVRSFDGRQVLLGYDSQGDLISVTQTAEGLPAEQVRVTQYAYLAGYTGNQAALNHNLERVAGPGTTLAAPEQLNVYGTDPEKFDFDRVIHQEFAAGAAGGSCCGANANSAASRSATFTYTKIASGQAVVRTTMTDSAGNITIYELDRIGGLVKKIEAATVPAEQQITTYTVNPDGETTSVTYPEGNQITYSYDETNSNRLSRGNMVLERFIPNAGGQALVTAYRYEPIFNHVVSETNPAGQTTQRAYDARGNLLVITNTLGYTATFEYDAHGNQTATTDFGGHRTIIITVDRYYRFIYLPLVLKGYQKSVVQAAATLPRIATPQIANSSPLYQKTVTTINALGHSTLAVYDAYGNLLRQTDANGHTTTYQYDLHNQLIQVTDALSHTTIYAYDTRGNRIRMTDANGYTTRYAYDLADRMTVMTDTLGYPTHYVYDVNGNRISESDALSHTTTYEYDAFDQLIRAQDALGNETRYAYDRNGNRISETDANGNTTAYTYDGFDRLIAITDALSHTTHFAYDAASNLRTVTDANGHTTMLDYNALNHLIRLSDPLSHTTQFVYDGASNLIRKTTANGAVITYTYDAVNRLVGVAYSDGATEARTYDAVGNLLTLTDPHTSLAFGYDPVNRPVTVTDRILGKTIAYTHDGMGNRTMLSGPGGNITHYQYDARGLVASITRGTFTAAYTYDPVGRLITLTLPNNFYATYQYAAANHLLALTNRRANHSIVSSFTYTVDNVGNRTAMTLANGDTVAYTYDKTYQLTGETRAGSLAYTQTYQYDPAGNRMALISNTHAITYTYDAADRLLAERGARMVDYNWDANGNMIGRLAAGQMTIYTYDFEDRMVGVTAPGLNARYTYDPFDRRTATQVNGVTARILYEEAGLGANALAEYNGNGALQALYLNGLEIDWNIAVTRGQNTYTYLHDGLGSVRELADQHGLAINRYDYDAFGNQLVAAAAAPNAYTFTGRQWDEESGLYYYRTRDYMAETGQFVQKDKMAIQMSTVQNHPSQQIGKYWLAMYRYAGNNPISSTDPLGQESRKECLRKCAEDLRICMKWTAAGYAICMGGCFAACFFTGPGCALCAAGCSAACAAAAAYCAETAQTCIGRCPPCDK